MRRRKGLWIGFAALCLLSLAVGWLVRPEDELAEAMRLFPPGKHPFHDNKGAVTGTDYFFIDTSDTVLRTLPGRRKFPTKGHPLAAGYNVVEIELPSGRRAVLDCWVPGPHEEKSCRLSVYEDAPKPWYTRAWLTLKHRLGLN
jgi:hypothetical protein